MPPPILLFSSTAPSQSRHVDTIERVQHELNPVSEQLRFRIALQIDTSPAGILQYIVDHHDDIGLFHFGGRDDDFQALLDAAPRIGVPSLPEYLATLPQLGLVFLAYCSRPSFVEELQDAGIQTIVGSSRRLTHQQTTEFASVFYQQFLVSRETTQDAFEAAVLQSQLSRTDGAYYAGLHGDNKLRRWWDIDPEPRILGPDPRILIVGDEAPFDAEPPTIMPLAEASVDRQSADQQRSAGQKPVSDTDTSTLDKEYLTGQLRATETSDSQIANDFLGQQLEKLRKQQPYFVDSGQAIALLADHTSLLAPNGKTLIETEDEWGDRSIEWVARLVDLDLLQKDKYKGQTVYRGHSKLDAEIIHRYIAIHKHSHFYDKWKLLVTRFLQAVSIRFREIIAVRKTLIDVHIDRSIEDFNDTEQERFIQAIAQKTDTSAKHIRIIKIESGSVMVLLEITANGALKLHNLSTQKDPFVVEENIVDVFIRNLLPTYIAPVPKIQSSSIRILFLAVNNQNTTPRRIHNEIQKIQETLQKIEFREKFEFVPENVVRVENIQDLFLRNRPGIVHFSGAGDVSGEIVLEDETSAIKPLSKDALGKLFSILRGNIRCVILNACYSESQARVIAEYIDCVIGMSDAISDNAAIHFSRAFYSAIGHGLSVDSAFKLGLNQIDLAGLDEQHIPQLFSRQGIDPRAVRFTEPELHHSGQKHVTF